MKYLCGLRCIQYSMENDEIEFGIAHSTVVPTNFKKEEREDDTEV